VKLSGKLSGFQIIFGDSEYTPRVGDLPNVICVTARNLTTGEEWGVWRDECQARLTAPYPCDVGSIFVAYNAMAELTTHIALGWPLPVLVIDLMAEFRVLTNRDLGKHSSVPGFSLQDALHTFNLMHLLPVDKEKWQQRCIDGDMFASPEDRVGLLNYCMQDVVAAEGLFNAMLPHLELELSHARWRGEWVKTNALMHAAGIPADVHEYRRLERHLPMIRRRMIEEVADYRIYDSKGRFSHQRFQSWLDARGYQWPKTKTGRLVMEDEVWRDQRNVIPEITRLADVKLNQSKLKGPFSLALGSDGRMRPDLIPLAAKSGRTAMKGNHVFVKPKWMRGVIRPLPGTALVYADYSAEEFLISGVISGDQAIIADYGSGDPYLHRAKLAGFAPPDATKSSHRPIREVFKVASLATAYGQTAEALAIRLQVRVPTAVRVLEQIQRAYYIREKYFDKHVNEALLGGWVRTSASHFRMRLSSKTSTNLLRNWSVQATGADVLMLAGPLIQNAGVNLIATVHDAALVECPIEDLEDVIEATRDAMVEASRRVLGVGLRVGVSRTVAPDRYLDEQEAEVRRRGELDMWTRVQDWLAEEEMASVVATLSR
jgi:DNA polymerase family A